MTTLDAQCKLRFDTRAMRMFRSAGRNLALAVLVAIVLAMRVGVAASGEADAKAPGEDLIAAELSALAAGWKYQQLGRTGRVSIPELRQGYLNALEVQVDDPGTGIGHRARIRGICALNRMPLIKQRVEAADAGPVLPDVHTYCLKAIEVSARRGSLADLYANLVLQEHGYTELHFAEQAKLLNKDEAGQTTARILRAANAGQTTYDSITGRVKELACPLALDAGYTWGYRNPDKKQPYELAAATVEGFARICYDNSTKEVSFNGAPVSAQKAGLLAGAWLGRKLSLESSVAAPAR